GGAPPPCARCCTRPESSTTPTSAAHRCRPLPARRCRTRPGTPTSSSTSAPGPAPVAAPGRGPRCWRPAPPRRTPSWSTTARPRCCWPPPRSPRDGTCCGAGAWAAPLAPWRAAEDARVVNHGAAARLLATTALAAGRNVLWSRGELVEIGAGFRLAELVASAGARVREVGTTNRTHGSDYREA